MFSRLLNVVHSDGQGEAVARFDLARKYLPFQLEWLRIGRGSGPRRFPSEDAPEVSIPDHPLLA